MATGVTPDAFAKPDNPRRSGLGSLPRPKLRPGAAHALLWMLYIAEVTQYGIPHQLTTGVDCTCPYVGQTWHDGPMCWEYQQEPDPDCLRHGWMFTPSPLPPVPPCTCRYRVYTTSVVHTVHRRPIRQRLVTGTGFDVDPGCVHHGDLRRVEYFDATYEPPYVETLDEMERGWH